MIQIQISELILIQMSVGTLPKCCGFSALSASKKEEMVLKWHGQGLMVAVAVAHYG